MGRTFALAFSLAAPFVTAALLYNIALGVINRAMPQLSVTFIGAPALTAGGLLLILVAALAASLVLGFATGASADALGFETWRRLPSLLVSAGGIAS